MTIVERIREIKRVRPLAPVCVLVPNRGSAAGLFWELCSALGSFAAIEIVPVEEYLAKNFDAGGRLLLTDTQRIIAIVTALADEDVARNARQLYSLRDNFALISKLNETFKQLEYLEAEDVDALLASEADKAEDGEGDEGTVHPAPISAPFRQCLEVFRRARALYAADYYEQAEVYRVAPTKMPASASAAAPATKTADGTATKAAAGTLLTYNLSYAPRELCALSALSGIVPPENRYNDELAEAKVPAEVSKLSDPETECVWAVQKVIQLLRDESLRPADIAITYCTDKGYSTLLKLYLDEAHIANHLQTSLSLNSSVLFRGLVEELVEAYSRGSLGDVNRLTPPENLLPLQRTAYARYDELLNSLEQFSAAGIQLTTTQLHHYIETYHLHQSIILDSAAPGELCVASVGELAGRAYKQLIVLGLSETIAPATFKPDSIINFDDIVAIQHVSGKNPFSTLAESIALQEQQFKLLAQKSGTLSISVPAQTSKGTELIESRWLANCIAYADEQLRQIPVNRMKLISRTQGEALSCPNDILSQRYFETIHNIADEIVIANRQLSDSRSRYNLDTYNGKITHPGLKKFFPEWSASRFELYARNPFDFFMTSVLGLDKPNLGITTEVFQELDAIDFGTLIHICLEDLTKLFVEQGELSEDSIETTLSRVLASLPDAQADWEDKYPEIFDLLRNSRVDEAMGGYLSVQMQEARQMLCAWQRHFLQEIEGYRVQTEQSFGARSGITRELRLLDGSTIALNGRIDRIDVHEATGLKRIIDYKTSHPRELVAGDLTADGKQSGRKFQLPLYAMLASEEADLADIEEAHYQYFGCEDAPHVEIATKDQLAQSCELTRAYFTYITACAEMGVFPYKANGYGSPFLRAMVDEIGERNRLSKGLHGQYDRILRSIEIDADQKLAQQAITALAEYTLEVEKRY